MPDKKKEREDKLAAALRENLKRRKAQARRLAEQPERNRNADDDRDKRAD